MIEIEEWRPVVGYEGRYAVSSLGRVKSLMRVVANGIGTTRIVKEAILAASGSLRNEYAIVNLAIEGKNKTYRVNVLVLEAFVSLRPRGMVSCHNDGNKQNNKRSNLRWDTQKGNLLDTVLHGTTTSGEKNAMAKFSNAEMSKPKADIQNRGDISYAEFARSRGLTGGFVSRIARGERWSSVGAGV